MTRVLSEPGFTFTLGILTGLVLALVGLACVLWTGQAMPPKPKGIGPR